MRELVPRDAVARKLPSQKATICSAICSPTFAPASKPVALAVRGGAAGSAPAHDGTALRHVLPQTFRLRRRKTYSSKLAPLHFYQLSLKAAPGLPEGTLGWTRDSAKRALRSLVGKIVVSGVTVFDRVQWGFAPAPEFFQCFPVPNERATEFAIRSRTEAEKWIDDFPRSDVLFVLEFSFQDDVAEGTGSV